MGATETLTATVNPDEAANKNVTWTSSDESVATVVNGVVTAVKSGTATITVTTEDGGYTDTCTVTVTIPATGVTLDTTTEKMTVGDEVTLEATVAPENATNKNVTWTSSDETVAIVANGVVTAVGAGTATITVTTEDGGFTAECTVTVEPKYVVEVNIEEDGDYVADEESSTKLVLVYTNSDDMTFKYNNIQMFDVTGAGYTYEGGLPFTQAEGTTKVYALVVDALAENTLAVYEEKIVTSTETLDAEYIIDYSEPNDINISGGVNWDDIISVYAVAEHNEIAFAGAMKVVIKADRNRDKMADANDATDVITAVYGG